MNEKRVLQFTSVSPELGLQAHSPRALDPNVNSLSCCKMFQKPESCGPEIRQPIGGDE